VPAPLEPAAGAPPAARAAGGGPDPGAGPALPPLPGAAWSIGTLALAAAAVWILLQVQAVFVVLIGSVLLAALLDPAVARLSRLRVGRRLLGRRGAAAVVVILGVGVLGTAFVLVAPAIWEEGTRLARDLPGYVGVARQKLLGLLNDPRLLPPGAGDNVQAEINRLLAEGGRQAAGWAVSFAANLLQILGYAVIPLGAFYILADRARLRLDGLAAVPPAWRPWARVFLDDSARALSAYVRGQSAVCATAAVLYSILFSLLGLPYGVALGVLAGLAEAVPFLGSLLAATIIGVTGLASGLPVALRGLAGYLVGNQVVNYAITPRFMSKELDLHPFYVILAALAGASLGGPGGALLALPAAAVAQTLVRRAWGGPPGAERPAPPNSP
jgi:predicted PurR-regulated permease PerM